MTTARGAPSLIDSGEPPQVMGWPMALLSQAVKEKEYDIRTMERGMAKGTVSHDVVAKHLKGLTDETELSQLVNTEEIYETIKGKSQLRND